jgi:hypothetical protein
VAGAVGASLAAVGSPATASASSWNDYWQYLHFPSRQSESLCTYRWITTGPGNYRWRVFSAHVAHQNTPRVKSRQIHLRRAKYRWVDCMPVSGSGFAHYSRLYNEDHGGMAELKGGYILGSWGNGRYHWGSTLDRVG